MEFFFVEKKDTGPQVLQTILDRSDLAGKSAVFFLNGSEPVTAHFRSPKLDDDFVKFSEFRFTHFPASDV